jgi:CHASE2 domain-containing sensor protein
MRIEPELVDAVLRQVEIGRVRIGRSGPTADGEPSDARQGRIQTPYLQLVLIRLWDEEVRAGSRVLRLSTLERLGGSERIVATHLDAAMETLSPQEQGVAASTFRYLVTPSGTKISQSSKDLAEYAELPEATVAPVLERLAGEARILQPAGDSRYEIYHDALAAPILEWRNRWEGRKLRGREQRRLFSTVGLAAGALALVAFANGIRDVELASIDARYALHGSSQSPNDVVLVAIDDRTFNELSRFRWPFPRSMHGRLVDRLSRAGASVIAYDIQFTEPTSAEEDTALVEAVERAGRRGSEVVLATTDVDQAGQSMIFGGEPVLRQIGARSGNALLDMDSDDRVRRVRYSTDGLKTFPVVSAEAALGREIRSSELGGKTAWIDFAGPSGTFRSVSFSRAVRGAVAPRTFRGKVVVVGPTAPVLQDIHDTPLDSSMSGAELQANGIVTALRGFPLKNPSSVLNLVLMAVLGLIAPLVSLRLSRVSTLLVALAVGGLFLVAAQLAFEQGYVLLLAYPLGALAFSTLAVLLLGGAEGERRMRGPSRPRLLPRRG